MNKYHNKITVVDGVKFHSKKEAKRWLELKLLEKAGLITDLQRQQTHRIELGGVLICKYISDFEYFDKVLNKGIVEDSKGMRTDIYKIKSKLMKAVLGIDILET